ncbi:MAG TPA: hypothetical protein VFP93_03915, partial [Gammaproteobacteria bacterium]|nr:hypothetical protein [Gammaproteobacteria bacterium]
NIAGFNLNATYNRKQNTLFCKIVKLAKARPDVLIDILSTIELENIDFNEIQKNKYNDTVLSSIFKIAVEMQTPAVIDTLLHFAPFRKLDFVTAKKYAFSLQSKNIIDWLSTTKYADSIPKIFEAGIRQGRKIWEALVKKLDDIEVYNRNFIIFKDHFIKLEDFAHCAQHQQCNTLLSEFYQYILTETNNENPNLSALRNLVQNFSEAIKEKKNDLQLLNDFCNTIACENSYFRKEIALTFAYRCNRERSSTCEYDEPLESLINIKTPVSTDDKKFLLDALIAMREIEDLKSLPCSTKKMVRIKEEKIQDNLVILNNIEKTMASISL